MKNISFVSIVRVAIFTEYGKIRKHKFFTSYYVIIAQIQNKTNKNKQIYTIVQIKKIFFLNIIIIYVTTIIVTYYIVYFSNKRCLKLLIRTKTIDRNMFV